MFEIDRIINYINIENNFFFILLFLSMLLSKFNFIKKNNKYLLTESIECDILYSQFKFLY